MARILEKRVTACISTRSGPRLQFHEVSVTQAKERLEDNYWETEMLQVPKPQVQVQVQVLKTNYQV